MISNLKGDKKKHKADYAKVADMHEARARKLGDVLRENKVLVKNDT